ncbi:hypothetical protein [Singulisphaera sp. PoT]|uniref:hypothetical protein n=1 Tax=Singulisphaera sp. PoT TaxID=3411797 RepID=UPI003BF56347
MGQTIVTAAEASANVPGFSALPEDAQADMVGAITDVVDGYCGRSLALAQFDELHEPENTRTIRLSQYPVFDVLRLCTGLAAVITVRCTDPAVSRATARLASAGDADGNRVATGLTLASTVAGVTTSTPLLFSDCPTLGSLAAAIDALPGWSAVVPRSTVPGAGGRTFADWSSADINPDMGAKGAIGTGAAYWAFPRDLNVYDLEPRSGRIAIHEDLYPAHRYPDRMYPASGQYGSVRCVYLAGYNNDPTLGPVTMPGALKAACYTLLRATLQRVAIGLLKSESISQRKVEYAQAVQGNLPLVADIVGNFKRWRLT